MSDKIVDCLVLLAECLKTTTQESEFKFKGMYKGDYVKRIILTPNPHLVEGKTYLIHMTKSTIVSTTMFGIMNKLGEI